MNTSFHPVRGRGCGTAPLDGEKAPLDGDKGRLDPGAGDLGRHDR